MKKTIPFVVFMIFLGLWTWKLLEPVPVPEAIEQQIPTDLRFWLAKSLHAGAYAFLTVLAAALPVRQPFFWAVVAVLALHGVGTEIGQRFIPNRNGCVRDVIIDWVGIGLGLLGMWACGLLWCAAGRSTQARPAD